jgi:hypothetical protein
MNASKKVVGLILACSGLGLAGCGSSIDEDDVDIAETEAGIGECVCPDDVPPALNPGADQKLELVLHADGDQVYTCKDPGTGFAWVVAPDADLYKGNGKHVGTHYAGPTWAFKDGSTVVATRVGGVTVDASAIPWLLLDAVSNTGDGKLSDVTTIQRMNTVGGLAPSTPCTAANAGAIVAVAYTADYFFYETGKGKHPVQCAGE